MEAEPSRSDRGADDQRVPLIMVAGVDEGHAEEIAAGVRSGDEVATVQVHHDLRQITQGVVRRRVLRGDDEELVALELAHGCVSCTLREDLLPLLRRLCAAPDVERIVLRLDPALEPETISWALQHVAVDGRTVDEDVDLQSVITAVDVPTWLTDVSGDEGLAERGLAASADDERTVAQVAVAQVEFADAIVLAGATDDRWHEVRTEAVISRLTPKAPQGRLGDDIGELLARVPGDARRGAIDGAHGALLRGQPSLDTDAGVAVVLFEERRPFHPERLHDAFDVLLEGVVRTRGRVWVASQPESALWLESAGGGLGIAHAGPWLCSVPREKWGEVDAERQVRASLNWDGYYGDRMQELVVIAHEANPHDITHALRAALLTDDELAAGEQEWKTYDDPFGEWHTDPCADVGDGETSEAADSGRESSG
jgi:G3E family GTPase